MSEKESFAVKLDAAYYKKAIMTNELGEHIVSEIRADEHEPPPKPGKAIVLDLVLKDLQDRAEKGKTKYGTYLMTHNGRNTLMDAYQEALDLVMYLRQALYEQENK